ARPLFDRRPLRDLEELRELAPWFRDWCDHDDPRDPYWRAISAADHAAGIDLAILHITGWYDYFTKGSLAAYDTMTRRGATHPTPSCTTQPTRSPARSPSVRRSTTESTSTRSPRAPTCSSTRPSHSSTTSRSRGLPPSSSGHRRRRRAPTSRPS